MNNIFSLAKDEIFLPYSCCCDQFFCSYKIESHTGEREKATQNNPQRDVFFNLSGQLNLKFEKLKTSMY